jgi:predicted O-methyltransferase YrrM
MHRRSGGTVDFDHDSVIIFRNTNIPLNAIVSRIWSAISRPRASLRLLQAFVRDPKSFIAVSTALTRYGSIQKPLELYELVRFVSKHRLDAVMEIGTWTGGTLYLWSRLAEPDATLISVDFPPKPDDRTLVERFSRFILPGQRLVCLREDSHASSTLDKVTQVLQDRRPSLLFIDGDHSYEGVKHDYEMYSPLVRPGGLIIFHDIIDNPEYPSYGVARFWNEIRRTTRYMEIVDPHHHLNGCGIGVLLKPS